MSDTKTHYRKAYKSDHLGTPDLEELIEEGKKLVFTIDHVTQNILTPGVKGTGISVAGRVISANIAHFKEDIKPLVLNSTNGKMIKKFANSSFIEDWKNILVELYIDSAVKMKGTVVGGIRIRSVQPVKAKHVLTPDSPKWEVAKKRVAEGMSESELKNHFEITNENFKLLCS